MSKIRFKAIIIKYKKAHINGFIENKSTVGICLYDENTKRETKAQPISVVAKTWPSVKLQPLNTYMTRFVRFLNYCFFECKDPVESIADIEPNTVLSYFTNISMTSGRTYVRAAEDNVNKALYFLWKHEIATGFKESDFAEIKTPRGITAYLKDVKNCYTLPPSKTRNRLHDMDTETVLRMFDLAIRYTPRIALLEYHRIREDDISLFTIKAADSDRIDDKFDEIPVKFQSTKATKTLATMIHAKAEENGQTNALFLVSAARSHRMHNGFSETTSIYLQESKLEGDPKEIARYVCRRGVFGWLYIAMLKYINKEIPSLENATTQVELLKSRIEPEQAERIAGFLQNAEREQKAVLKQLSTYSRENISNFLMQLGTANTTTSLPETYCIFGKACSKVRTEPTACLHCYSSLKTNYTLELIGKNLSTLLSRMNEITLSNITERQKLTFQIQKLLFILMDAKSWYNKYDPKFLNTYVDLPKIQAALSTIPDYKFLQLEEKHHESNRVLYTS